MSLGVFVKGPEGVVLAADTRVTLRAQAPNMQSPLFVNFDNATKLLSFGSPHDYVGAVTYGDATIGQRTAHGFLPELEPTLGDKRLTVLGYAKKISEFFQKRWTEANGKPSNVQPGGGMNFIVGGYDKDQPYGEVFIFNIPTSPDPQPRNEGSNFGMTWGGQLEIASRLIHGYDPNLLRIVKDQLTVSDEKIDELRKGILTQLEYRIPYDMLPLQDCIDLAAFLIRTTITAQNLAVAMRGVGGSIEVATITRTESLKWIQKKDLHGEV